MFTATIAPYSTATTLTSIPQRPSEKYGPWSARGHSPRSRLINIPTVTPR
jgi:hypothetical protein